MMEALVHRKTACDFNITPHLMDIQQLNENALLGKYDISKVSAAIYPLIKNEYDILDAGAAMGFGVGPILVSKNGFTIDEVENLSIAIPGKHTTANALFRHFYKARSVHNMIFSDIEQAILHDKADAGVLIHEGRFTYHQKGLQLMQDLGAKWEEMYNLPIPLGILVVRKEFHTSLKQMIDSALRKSIEFAFGHPASSANYIKEHAQEMQDHVVRQHIELYVNDYSISMGKEGKKALEFLWDRL